MSQTSTSTSTTPVSNMTELPTILNGTDIDNNFLTISEAIDRGIYEEDELKKILQARTEGKQVRIIGQYTQVDVRKRPKPPPQYRGNVAVVLEDRRKVYLYPMWHPEAKRPSEEIARYENQQVIIVGKIVPRAPESPEATAMIISPCLLTIDSIELADDEN
ncbi:MAG: hypothetical protein WA865_23220 [Spirulinaceae cyanobacterium]